MDVLLEKSLINCHCLGMDSLVLKEGPNMIRMFVARPEHTLWKNNPAADARFSVAMHRHHCDVTLQPITGEIYNVVMSGRPHDSLTTTKLLRSYKYTSHILEGEKAGFKPVDDDGLYISLRTERLTVPRYMSADELHSVYVPARTAAAWYVWEGKENDRHNNVVYTNDYHIERLDFSEFDLPMTEERLREDLAIIGVYSAR